MHDDVAIHAIEQIAPCRMHQCADAKRQPEIWNERIESDEVDGRPPDDLDIDSFHCAVSAYDTRAFAEPRPVVIADDCNRRGTDLVVPRHEHAPERGRTTEREEVVPGDHARRGCDRSILRRSA